VVKSGVQWYKTPQAPQLKMLLRQAEVILGRKISSDEWENP
jgi:hypothetical protein